MKQRKKSKSKKKQRQKLRATEALAADELDRGVLKRLHHLERNKLMVDAFKARQASHALRHQWLEGQKKNNYAEEYHRIVGDLEGKSIFPQPLDGRRLLERVERLRELGALAVGS